MGAIPAVLVLLAGLGLGELMARTVKWRWPIWARAIAALIAFYAIFSLAAIGLALVTPDDVERIPGYAKQVMEQLIGVSALAAGLFFWRLKAEKIPPIMVGMCLALMIAVDAHAACTRDGKHVTCDNGLQLVEDHEGVLRDAKGQAYMVDEVPGSSSSGSADKPGAQIWNRIGNAAYSSDGRVCTGVGDTMVCS